VAKSVNFLETKKIVEGKEKKKGRRGKKRKSEV